MGFLKTIQNALDSLAEYMTTDYDEDERIEEEETEYYAGDTRTVPIRRNRRTYDSTRTKPRSHHSFDEEEYPPYDEDAQSFDSEVYAHVPQVLLLFLLDISGSMKGSSITMLNDAMNKLRREIEKQCPEAKAQLQVAVCAYNSDVVQTYSSDFQMIESFVPSVMRASGSTNDAKAILHANKLIEDRILYLVREDCSVYRPIIVSISDGLSHSTPAETEAAIASVEKMNQKYGLKIWEFTTLPESSSQYDRHMNHLKLFSENIQPINTSDYTKIIDFSVDSMRTISRLCGTGNDTQEGFSESTLKKHFTVRQKGIG